MVCVGVGQNPPQGRFGRHEFWPTQRHLLWLVSVSGNARQIRTNKQFRNHISALREFSNFKFPCVHQLAQSGFMPRPIHSSFNSPYYIFFLFQFFAFFFLSFILISLFPFFLFFFFCPLSFFSYFLFFFFPLILFPFFLFSYFHFFLLSLFAFL